MEYGRTSRGNEEGVSTDFLALILSSTNLQHRAASKWSGPAVEAFMRRMQELMGVVMIGFATYRNEEGKLYTFEYVTFLPSMTHPKLTSI